MNVARSVALAFMACWSEGIDALRASIETYFTDQTVWENVGLNRLVGRNEALAFIDDFHDRFGFDSIQLEIVALVSRRHLVLSERIDHLCRSDGSIIHSTRLMGLFEVRNEKIAAQRDYFHSVPAPGAR